MTVGHKRSSEVISRHKKTHRNGKETSASRVHHFEILLRGRVEKIRLRLCRSF